jgi:hypothetical protein
MHSEINPLDATFGVDISLCFISACDTRLCRARVTTHFFCLPFAFLLFFETMSVCRSSKKKISSVVLNSRGQREREREREREVRKNISVRDERCNGGRDCLLLYLDRVDILTRAQFPILSFSVTHRLCEAHNLGRRHYSVTDVAMW